MFIRKKYAHQYLIRFLLTVLLFIILLSFCLFFILGHSYNKLEQKNFQSYQNITDLFAAYMQNELNFMRNQALTFSVRSRTETVSIPDITAMNSNPYYFIRVTEAMKSQSALTPYSLILYYKNMDSVFSSQHKYSREEYISIMANGNAAISAALNSFFSSSNQEHWVFMSTFPYVPLHDAVFYIGIPIKIGVDYQEALFIYMLAYNNINVNMFAMQSASNLSLMLFDADNRLLYANMPYNEEILAASGIFEPENQKNPHSFTYDNSIYSTFQAKPSILPFQCVSLMESDAITADIHAFYSFTRNLTLCMLAALTVFAGVIIYKNYIPILQLLHRVVGQPSPQNGELESIEGEFTRMREEIREQHQLIIESLISNLLYGAVVPQKLFEKTLFYEHSGNYCVYTIKEMRFDAVGRARLLERIKHVCHADGYITDMLYENFTVLICLLSDVPPEEISRQIQSFVEDILKIQGVMVYTGSVVHDLNSIQHSYQACLREMAPRPSLGSNSDERDLMKKRFCEEVSQYINDNLSSADLSQTIVADHFSISTYSLSRLFREQLGIGFSEYITARRLDKAKHLLLSTSMRIFDVAQNVGFSDAKYFSRIFKANVGVTPNEFRHDPAQGP